MHAQEEQNTAVSQLVASAHTTILTRDSVSGCIHPPQESQKACNCEPVVSPGSSNSFQVSLPDPMLEGGITNPEHP